MIVAGLRFSKFRRSPSRRACRRGADSSGRAADNSPSFTRVSGEIEGLIPSPIDQNWCAHWRNPMDMMRQG